MFDHFFKKLCMNNVMNNANLIIPCETDLGESVRAFPSLNRKVS